MMKKHYSLSLMISLFFISYWALFSSLRCVESLPLLRRKSVLHVATFLAVTNTKFFFVCSKIGILIFWKVQSFLHSALTSSKRSCTWWESVSAWCTAFFTGPVEI
jgi:hypothetical protein